MTAFDTQTSSPGRLPPHNVEAEESILGGILLDPSALGLVKSKLPPDAFFMRSHRDIYKACLELDNQGRPTDLMTVTTWLYDHNKLDLIGGQNKMAQLVDRTISAVNIEAYADLILEKFTRRRIIEVGQETIELGYQTSLDLGAITQLIPKKIAETCQGNWKDKDLWQHQQLIKALHEIELIPDPSQRYFKQIRLGKEFGLSARQLEDLYYKSLVNDENEPAMRLDEFEAKYGAAVQEWVLHGLFARGKTSLIYGQGGAGKSRLAYNQIRHLLTGTTWNGFPVTRPSQRVLIVQTDETANDMIGVLKSQGFDDQMDVFLKSRWSMDHMNQLEAEIKELKIDLVLIDSVTSANQFSIYSENDVPYARPLLKAKKIAQDTGCHIAFIHHACADGSRARGTTAITNAVSDVLAVGFKDGDRQSPVRLLKIEKSRSRAPGIYELLFDPEESNWLILGKVTAPHEKESPESLKIKDRILMFLQGRGGTRFESQEISHEMGLNANTTKRCLNELAAEARINKAPGKDKANVYWVGSEGVRYVAPDRDAIAQIKDDLLANEVSLADDDKPEWQKQTTGQGDLTVLTPPITTSDRQQVIGQDRHLDLIPPASDQVITQNLSDRPAEVLENTRSLDHLGVEPNQGKGSEVITSSDHPSDQPDQLGDRDQEEPKEENKSFQVGDLVRSSDFYSSQFEWRGIVTHVGNYIYGTTYDVYWPELAASGHNPEELGLEAHELELIDEMTEVKDAIAKLNGKKSPHFNTLRKQLKEWEFIGDSKPLKVEEGSVTGFFKAIPGGSRCVLTARNYESIAFDTTFLNPKEIKDFVSKLAREGEAYTPCGKRVLKRKVNFMVFNQNQ